MEYLNDAFNNSGLPQYANKTINDFTKNDVRKIIATIKDNDNYYISGWMKSNDRKLLIDFVNNISVFYRWYSLIIK